MRGDREPQRLPPVASIDVQSDLARRQREVGLIDSVWIEPVTVRVMMNLDRAFPRSA